VHRFRKVHHAADEDILLDPLPLLALRPRALVLLLVRSGSALELGLPFLRLCLRAPLVQHLVRRHQGDPGPDDAGDDGVVLRHCCRRSSA